MVNELEEILLKICKEKEENEFLEYVPLDNVEGRPSGMEEFKNYPHLFVLGAIMDRQIPAEQAWDLPRKIALCLGGKDFSLFANKSQDYYYKIFEKGSDGKSLHRFNRVMAECFYSGIQDIKNKYSGDASKIWDDNPTAKQLIKRFEEFKGVGQKISTMAVNILRRDYKINISDLSYIDISADVHVIRVFKRMGFVKSLKDKDSVIEKAREMNPDFPGIFDVVVWGHGKDICKSNPLCNKCEFEDICPKNI
ncbi:MAG: hypothetical protein LBM26_03290 [Methanobrevibacter sp.]|jgi:hypothetical protein|nr:hypothetical protein [Methanobrevibacter sp.]